MWVQRLQDADDVEAEQREEAKAAAGACRKIQLQSCYLECGIYDLTGCLWISQNSVRKTICRAAVHPLLSQKNSYPNFHASPEVTDFPSGFPLVATSGAAFVVAWLPTQISA